VRGEGDPLLTSMLVALSTLPRPTVHLSTETDEDTRDRLLVRLGQEGFALTGDREAAELELEVRDGVESWRVSARGIDERAYDVPHGPVAVERLELVHWSLAALEETTARTQVSPPPPHMRFVIGFADTVDASARDLLRARVAWQIASAGGTAVAEDAEGEPRRVCVGQQGSTTVLSFADERGRCSASAEAVPIGGAQAWLRAAIAPPVAVETVAAPPAIDPVSPRAPEPTTRAPHQRTNTVRLGARAGLVARPRVDPAAAADLRVGRDPGPQLWVEVQAWSSRARAIDLQVIEVLPGVGARWRLAPHRRVAIDFGVQGQLLAHRYRARGSQGVRFDAAAEASTALAVRLVGGLELEVDLRGGVASRPRSHHADGIAVWSRSQLRLCAMTGLGWRFELGPAPAPRALRRSP
jgi:hypothetical protein